MRNFTASLSKRANIQLPSNPDLWTDVIYEQISRMHPYIAGSLQGDIDWSVEPVDEAEGNGVGSAIALLGDQPIQIPIVVRDFELKPIDLYVTPDGDMDVLSRNVVMHEAATSPVEVGHKISPYAEHTLYDRTSGFPGLIHKVGSYSRAREDAERIAAHVAEDFPKLAKSWKRIIDRLASDSAHPYDTLAMTDQGGAFKIAVFRKGHRIENILADKAKIYRDLGSKVAHIARASRGSSGIHSERTLDKTALTASRTHGVLSTLTAGDTARVTSGGEEVKGSVHQPVSLRNPYPDAQAVSLVFVAKDGRFLAPLSGEVAPGGGEVAVTDATTVSLRELQDGQYGFLVVPQADGKKALAGPMRLQGWIKNINNEERMHFRSRQEGPVYVALGKVAPKIIHVRQEPSTYSTPGVHINEYVVPESYRFLVLSGEIVPEQHSDPEAKLAEDALENGTSVIKLSSSRGSFHAKVDPVEYDLNRAEARAFLMSLGATPESATDAVKVAEEMEGQVVSIYGLERPVAEHRGEAKLASSRQVDRLIRLWADKRAAINKLAAELPDEEEEEDDEESGKKNPFAKKKENPFAKKEDEGEAPQEGPEEKPKTPDQSRRAGPFGAQRTPEEGEEEQAQEYAGQVPNQMPGQMFAAEEDELQESAEQGGEAPDAEEQDFEEGEAAEGEAAEEEAAGQQMPGQNPEEGAGPAQRSNPLTQQSDPYGAFGSPNGLQDSLNTLNMINQYTASNFAESSGEIEEAKQVVADILYRVRTGGLSGMEEGTVKDALVALDAILSSLNELRASSEQV